MQQNSYASVPLSWVQPDGLRPILMLTRNLRAPGPVTPWNLHVEDRLDPREVLHERAPDTAFEFIIIIIIIIIITIKIYAFRFS
jgi:hypothetical protein